MSVIEIVDLSGSRWRLTDPVWGEGVSMSEPWQSEVPPCYLRGGHAPRITLDRITPDEDV
jgi:hypothetical protein